MRQLLLVAFLCSVAAATTANAQIVPGYIVEDYAFVTDPVDRSFMPDGTLYVGRDNFGSGGGSGDPVKIHQIGIGGAPVIEWGVAPIEDPDSVLADPTGLYAPAGSVLVASSNVGLGGGVRAVLPDQSIIDVFAPDLSVVNPNSMEFDNTGRLLVGEDRAADSRILVPSGGSLVPLITLPGFGGFTVDPATNNIYTNVFGAISIYDDAGTLLDGSFATLAGAAGMAFGPGNALWGSDLYALIGDTGELVRVDSLGNVTVVGTGFIDNTFGPTFGPDGYMYLSSFDQDKIIRIVPEPASLALIVLGGLALHRRRR